MYQIEQIEVVVCKLTIVSWLSATGNPACAVVVSFF